MNSRMVTTLFLAGAAIAQGPADFPQLTNAGIAGAPQLGSHIFTMCEG